MLPLRILIADDHDVVRCGLRSVLEQQDNWQVVAEAKDGQEAIARAIDTGPHIAIIDYSMPGPNGAEVTRQIRARLPETEILVFTMHDNESFVHDVLAAGARGYLLKSDARQHLVAAIESLAVHRPYFSAGVSEVMLQAYRAMPDPESGLLTTREHSVVRLIAEGLSNREIASALNIGIKTVETHRAAAMQKLHLPSRAALVRYAVRNNMVEP
jgi:DNA-binding NarL/FixJ family response regulator